MGDKRARPLGNSARQMIRMIDWELASAYRKLAAASDGTPMLRAEVQLVATQVRGHLSEARRMISEVEKLGLPGTGPLGDEP